MRVVRRSHGFSSDPAPPAHVRSRGVVIQHDRCHVINSSRISMIDLRFFARRKTLTAIAVLTMGLAIGANTAALSVLKAFFGSSLAVPNADRVVVVQPERNL